MRLVRIAFLFCALAWVLSAHAQGGMMPGPGTVHSTGGGGGSVTADVIGTEKYQANSSTVSYTGLTTGTPTGLGLVCVWARAHASNDVTAGLTATWNGVSMTLIKSQIGIGTTEVSAIFGLHNPASGAHTASFSATNSATDNFVNCISFSNVNQTSDAAAFPNSAGASGAATLAVTSASGHIAVGATIDTNNGNTILGTTIYSDFVNGSLVNAFADYVASTTTSTTVGSSNATTSAGIAAVDVSN